MTLAPADPRTPRTPRKHASPVSEPATTSTCSPPPPTRDDLDRQRAEAEGMAAPQPTAHADTPRASTAGALAAPPLSCEEA
jgi:hypothetical protein